jgi:UDP-3-O-[3-hydroxymyristoyl] glucosamine N-acyltransferase
MEKNSTLSPPSSVFSPSCITLGQIAELVGCVAPAAKVATQISGVAGLKEAGPTEISFLAAERYYKQFQTTNAAVVLVDDKIKLRAPAGQAVVLKVRDAELAMSRVLELFAPPVPRPPVGVDPSARVHPTAELAENVAIGPFSIVGARCKLGRGTILHGGVYVGDDVIIGEDCQIFPHVVIRERIDIGKRVVIHANSVLGTDGFGYRWDGAKHAKVPQIGTVIIEDDVEIGSCVCIDRAKFGTTRVGRGTKIDNLVQVGHNVEIGPHCIVVGHVGLAGSAKLGAGVVLGGQVAVRDHVTMGDASVAAACSAVAEDVAAGTVVSGTPALPHRQSLREQAALRRLPDLIVQVRKLQEQIDEAKKKAAN